jgi:NADH:ubiquinone oxidoreductase subunit 6 (subunit J)
VIELLLFLVAAACAALGALGAATVRNLFHAALLLGLSLVGVAGLYLFLEAEWLACVQVVVYVGGILVLVLFATLFSADVRGLVQRTPVWLRLLGGGSALLSGAVAVRLLQVTLQHGRSLDHVRGAGDGTGDGTIGDLLVGPWLVPFLTAGLLLTIALVGAVATVKRFRRPAAAVPAEAAHPEADHG